MDYVQLRGRLRQIRIAGAGRAKRLGALLQDQSGEIDLIWFQGISWVIKGLREDGIYRVFGRLSVFNGSLQIAHPELEEDIEAGPLPQSMEPIYSSTEKLKSRGLNNRSLAKLTRTLLDLVPQRDLGENIPESVRLRYKLVPRFQAFRDIHFPKDPQEELQAVRRIKFEELFYSQLRIIRTRMARHLKSKGFLFPRIGPLFHEVFGNHLPFELTQAQKKVLREIRQDTLNGRQMNRLLQGDVGSGKTIVALLSMLIAADNGFQACLMAPTEILAQQHFQSIQGFLQGLPLRTGLLMGSVKGKSRRELLEQAAEGSLNFLVGTHALIEAEVGFRNLGLAIVDEQHRFGVAQRAALWEKNEIPPHVLVMTATPIPRTLAMTVYGELDLSVMDELPKGRRPVQTIYRNQWHRPQVMDFIRDRIAEGHQAYFVYPLIEESEKLDYENLMKGFEEVKAFFPEPNYLISMIHGRQATEIRQANMRRFVEGQAQIMVATTVIEVGVDVPNASVMVIENAEKFGLSQLHQLRGRVGRGAEQSYCILLTGMKLGRLARDRVRVMTQTNNGFLIAEKDMELRGPGEIEGTRQSGVLNFKLADIQKDKAVLEAASAAVQDLLTRDPDLVHPENQVIEQFLSLQPGKPNWSKIS